MSIYDFSIVLANAGPNVSDIEDRLFEAGCDDGLLCWYGNTGYIEFDREASSAEEAISSAIENIRAAGFDVTSVQEAGYATQSDIASMANLTRAAISNYILGKRGPGDFPAPEFGLGTKTPMYFWPSVAEWLVQNELVSKSVWDTAQAAFKILPPGSSIRHQTHA